MTTRTTAAVRGLILLWLLGGAIIARPAPAQDFPQAGGGPLTTEVAGPTESIPAAVPLLGVGDPSIVSAPEDAPTPLLLMKALGRPDDAPIRLYGWIQNSVTGNTNGRPPSGVNFGLFPNHLANQWMGNQYYAIVENPLTRGDRIDFGFRVDTLFGNDAAFTRAANFLDDATVPNSFANVDLPQLFVEAHLPVLTTGGLDVKFGRWYNFAGFEAVPAIQRPLLSWAYTMPFFPFTFSGGLGTLHMTDRLDLSAGVVDGFDRFFDAQNEPNPLAALRWISPDEKAVFTAMVVTGPNPTRVNRAENVPRPTRVESYQTYLSNTLTYQWTDRLTQAVQIDWIHARAFFSEPLDAVLGHADWYVYTNWFVYEFSERWIGTWRTGIFRDDQGAITGVSDTFYEMTLGLIHKPRPWLWLRPEARYDWAQFKQPFNDGTRDSRFTIGFDVILLY